MAIVAPYSKHKKGNFKIFAAVLVIAAVVFAYDGYLSKYQWSKRYSFYEKNMVQTTNPDGTVVVDDQGNPVLKPTGTMTFNRNSPPFFLLGAAVFGLLLLCVRNKKIVLDDNKLIGEGKEVNIDNIEKVNKTNFEKKGIFTITYKDQSGNLKDWTISDRKYDNLKPMLDEIVDKISG